MTGTGVDRHTLWAQLLDLYARPGVQPACLYLQDECGVDIVLLLFSLALGRCRRQPLAPLEIDQADRLIANWRALVVQPLRGIRRVLKDGIDPVPVSQSGPIRQAIKNMELAAEKLAFDMLASQFADRAAFGAPAGWAPRAVGTVVVHFAGSTGFEANARCVEAISAIAQAAEMAQPHDGP